MRFYGSLFNGSKGMTSAVLAASTWLFLSVTVACAQEPPRSIAAPPPNLSGSKEAGSKPASAGEIFKESLGFYCETLKTSPAPGSPARSLPRAWIGIWVDTFSAKETPGADSHGGFYPWVAGLVRGGPAYMAGIRVGDAILKVGGASASSSEQSLLGHFEKLLEGLAIGEPAKFLILRGGKTETVEAVPAARPKIKLRPEPERGIVCPQRQGASVLQSQLEKQGLAERFQEVGAYLEEGAGFVHFIDGDAGEIAPAARLGEVEFLLSYPLKTLPAAAMMAGKLSNGLRREKLDPAGFFRAAYGYLDYPVDRRGRTAGSTASTSDGKITPVLDELVGRIVSAGDLIKAAFSGLSPAELSSMRSHIAELLGDDFPEKGGEVLSPEQLLQLTHLAAKVDFGALASAAEAVFSALSREMIDSLAKEMRRLEPKSGVVEAQLLLSKESPAGKIIVGGSGKNIYVEDAALIIDLGGDDLYLNNAGASTDKIPVSVVIDLAGDDVYIGGGPIGQGAGLMGIGALIDFGGDDSYNLVNSGQGLGAFGAGALVDLSGSDHYRAGRFAQGAGLFGAGLLFDSSGDDSYSVEAIGQGVGGPSGLGALVDSSGDDRYSAGSRYRDYRDPESAYDSFAQGFGFGLRPRGEYPDIAGGIGVLIDSSGDDFYVGDYFAQGSSYWYSLGVLIDMAGDDSYLSGRYAQGAGVHLAVGALLDYSGSDSYFAGYGVAQGVGHDRAFGLLFDAAGDDGYFSGPFSQGVGIANGIGLMIDAGGSNAYSASSPGRGWGVKHQNRGSFGAFLDLGGGKTFHDGPADANDQAERGAYGFIYDGRKSEK